MSAPTANGTLARKVGSGIATGGFSNEQDLEYARSTHTVYVDFTGTITTASLQLQASPDRGVTWYNIGSPSTATTDGTFSVTGVAASYTRVAVTITGGGTASLGYAAA